MPPIDTNSVYEFVAAIIKKSSDAGFADISSQLDNAMQLGSSALEVLGAIRGVLNTHKKEITNLLGSASEHKIDLIDDFVEKLYTS